MNFDGIGDVMNHEEEEDAQNRTLDKTEEIMICGFNLGPRGIQQRPSSVMTL